MRLNIIRVVRQKQFSFRAFSPRFLSWFNNNDTHNATASEQQACLFFATIFCAGVTLVPVLLPLCHNRPLARNSPAFSVPPPFCAWNGGRLNWRVPQWNSANTAFHPRKRSTQTVPARATFLPPFPPRLFVSLTPSLICSKETHARTLGEGSN